MFIIAATAALNLGVSTFVDAMWPSEYNSIKWIKYIKYETDTDFFLQC